MKYRNIITFLIILVIQISPLIFAQKMLEGDFPEMAKKIVIAEILGTKYDELYERYASELDTVKRQFEKLATDSILRITFVLDDYYQITEESLNNNIFKIRNIKIRLKNDSINLVEVQTKDEYTTGGFNKFKIAMDYRGNFYPIYGFRKIALEALYKSYFNNNQEYRNFIKLYLEHFLNYPDSMIAFNENISNLKRYFPTTNSFEFSEFNKDTTNYYQCLYTVDIKYKTDFENLKELCIYSTYIYCFMFDSEKYVVSKVKINQTKAIPCK